MLTKNDNRSFIFDVHGGGQALVTVYASGKATIAFRQEQWHPWGPPQDYIYSDTF